MTQTKLLQVVAIIALVITATAFAIPLATANNVADIDKDHKLGKEAPENWGPTASSDLIHPDVTITVAEEASACGYKGKTNDAANSYICVKYEEELDRTLRFDIHQSFIKRIDKEGLKSLDGDETANLESQEKHTRVTMDVDGKTTAIFAVNRVESNTQGWWRKQVERADKAKGGLFGSSTGEEFTWEYYEDHELAEGELVINQPREDIQIEYDSKAGAETKWRMVPDDPGKNPPVYWYAKEGEEKTRIVSQDVNGTAVRIKEGGQKGFWAQGLDDFWSVDRGTTSDDGEEEDDSGWWPF